jgi:uncharacterized protein (DUF2236 family)
VRYFAMVAFGDSVSTTRAADVLVKIHSKAIGEDRITGRRYNANDPDSQLWIHLTGWHSVLKAYEKYGPGELSDDEENRYWAECAVAAELQTCDPGAVPRTREDVRAYFDAMRPQLIGSDVAKQAMNHLLRAEVMLPPMPLPLRPATLVVAAFVRRGTLASMPRWMREMAGLSTSGILDAAVTPPLRTAFRAIASSTRLQLALFRLLSPSTVEVAARAICGVPPIHPVTTTPRQAQARHGYGPPRLAHQDLRARQHRRVFGQRLAASDEGLIESQPILGTVG